MTVYNFGSINIDLVYRVPHLVNPGETLSSQSMHTLLGGKGANQSVALARAGVPVSHVGRIGHTDSWAVEQMEAAGVDITHIDQIDGASGHAIIQVDDKGENSIILHGGANQSFDRALLESHLQAATSDDWLLVQNECNDIAYAFEVAVSKGMKIMFNPAPMTAEVAALPLEQCAVLIVNETEAESLAGTADPSQILVQLATRYPDTRLVMTLGSKGALLQHAGSLIRHDALNVEVVDTTGAGDTFVGYFLASMISGLDDASCLQRACTAAALSVTQSGAAPSIPDAHAVDAYTI